MNKSRLALERRVFLGALGVGISAPIAIRMSRLAVAAPTRPRRLVIVFIPHGVPIEHYLPQFDGTRLNLTPSGAAGFTPVPILAPLQPYIDKVTVLFGVSMNAGANNHAAVRAVLTGFPEGEGSDSIDTIIGSKLGVQPLVLGALGYDALFGFNENCHLAKQGTWVVPEINPAKAADGLFGAPAGTTPAVDETMFRAQALDLTEREIESLQTTLAGLTREQNKLQVHLDAVRAIKAGGAGANTCTGRPSLPTVEAVRGKNVQDVANFTQVLDAHLELVAAALSCGATNLVTLQNMYVNAQYKMDFTGGPGVSALYHDPTSHSQQPDGRAQFAQVQRWFYDRLATKLMAVLATTPDAADTTGSRTVLDNTLIVTCSEIADGFFHNSQALSNSVPLTNGTQKQFVMPLPYVFMGGGSGYFKMGQLIGVDFPGTMHTDVLATLADYMGAPITSMGGQSVSVIQDLKA